MPDTIADRLAAWGLSLDYRDLPPEVVHEVKRRIMDSLGCIIGAHSSPPAVAAVQLCPAVKKGASIIGWKKRTTPELSAFVNGVMVRYLDFNDTYLSKEPAHPSDNIPVAIACSQSAGRNGRGLITAVAAAYEIQCRLCDAASLRARGWDHVTYGAFSGTVCAAMLLGLSAGETVNALGIIGASSPALRQTRAGQLTMWKGCAFADVSKRAVFAAMLAKKGVTGPTEIFEGRFGFMNLVSGKLTLPPFAGHRGWDGQRFKILDACIKYYPVEYHAQSAVGAASGLFKEIKGIADIESVKVETCKTAYDIIGSGPEKKRPSTRETADHSLPYCVAAALADGGVTLKTFSAERLKDKKLLNLVDKVTVTVDGRLDRLYPKAVPNRVELRLKNGRVLSKEILYPKGHPKNPMSDKEVEAKFTSLASRRYGDKEIKRMLTTLWRIEGIKDISGVLKLFDKVKR